MSAADIAVHQKVCMPQPYKIWPYSWDMAQEKSKCSQTKPHLDFIVVLKPAKKIPFVLWDG
jgi:hypothetical protein